MKHLLTVSLLVVFATGALHASRSGLNNIPTADTVAPGTYVTQAYTRFGGDIDQDFLLGFKTGLDVFGLKFELGFDSRILPGKGGPIQFQGKYALPLGEGLPTLGLGVSTLGLMSDDRERGGEPTSYLILSQDFGGHFRGHLGYEF